MSNKKNIDKAAAKEFLTQTNVYIEEYCQSLAILPSKPTGRRAMNKAIQAMQSIKGAAGFSDFKYIEELAQNSIAIISAMREKDLLFSDELFKALVLIVKSLRREFAALKKSGHETAKRDEDLLTKILQLKRGSTDVGLKLTPKQQDSILNIQSVENTNNSSDKDNNDELVAIKDKEEVESSSEIEQNSDIEPEAEISSELKLESEPASPVLEQGVGESLVAESQYIKQTQGKIIIELGKEVALADIETLHKELDDTELAEIDVIEVHTESLENANTALLQLLFSLQKSNAAKDISFPEMPGHIQSACKTLGMQL